MASLSKSSIYETLFRTRHRRSGRPSGGEVVFAGRDVHPLIKRVASRRAAAVVLEENKERLSEVYGVELRVLNRRGVEQVARDMGVEQ